MTKEEKKLLLVDLCARLPYGVKVNATTPKGEKTGTIVTTTTKFIHLHQDSKIFGEFYVDDNDECFWLDFGLFKPYLRPMSSMTEDEKLDYIALGDIKRYTNPQYAYLISEQLDYLNAHYFDYRGLIPMGLALEAPEGMYNKEESETGGEIPIPKTVDEAVKTLDKIISKEDRDYLLENGAISMHDSLGRWIRNEWGLWTGSELKDELMNMHKGLNHPDDMSNYIIEEFIKYWNNKI